MKMIVQELIPVVFITSINNAWKDFILTLQKPKQPLLKCLKK